MDPFLTLANKLYEVVISNVCCLRNWGFYLFDKHFESEVELRNRVATLWICSQFDTLEAQKHRLPKIRAEAQQNGWPTLVHASDQLEKFCTLISRFIGNLSREEQIYLLDFRNQLVHSYLSGIHESRIKVKCIHQGQFVTENISTDQYNEIIRSFYEGGKTVDQVVAPLVTPLLNRENNPNYWLAIESMQFHSDEIYRILREGEIFNISL